MWTLIVVLGVPPGDLPKCHPCTNATSANGQTLSRQLKDAAKDESRATEPTVPKRSIIRFLTANDFPPFNYLDEDGVLTGFNVDVARAVCLELEVTCDIQARAWDELIPALRKGDADAVIASIALKSEALAKVDFSERYYHTPARFVARRDRPKEKVTPEGLEGRRVGVVEGTAHQAYLKAFFPDCIIVPFASHEAARKALAKGKVDYQFGDGMSLMFWLNGTLSRSCCEFRGGAYAEPAFFGDGVGVAISKGDHDLKKLINRALGKIRTSGRIEELFLRYFPLKVY